MKNPLLDNDFLYALNQHQHKEIYARIIALTFDESPLETIEGRVTSGSINIDGNSAVRRTCNLSLIAKDVNITDFYWGVSNKFTLEIGVNNNIDEKYPNIIWFPQGIYVISSFSSSLTQNNYSISISGKDKMCLLNGDVGGSLPSSIDFGAIDIIKDVYSSIEFEDFSKYEANKYYIYDLTTSEYKISTASYDPKEVYYIKDQVYEQEKLTIKNIILEAVHTYGKEAYQNIIINDLDECGLEMLQYRGDKDLYLLYNEDASIYDQMTINGNYIPGKCIFPYGKEDIKISVDGSNLTTDDKEDKLPIVYNNAIDSFNDDRWKFKTDEGTEYSITKISNAEDSEGKYDSSAVGYRATELTYAGDLVSSIGESLTSVLDKIKNMLGAFEYFYDLKGKFVFQAKKIYSNQSWNSLVETDGNVFARDAIEDSPYSYSFEDVNLIQKFTNTPAINEIKNDYSIWGTRESVTGAEIPIHARYAIDKKPVAYTSIDVSEDEAKALMELYPDRYLKLDKTMQTSKRYSVDDYDWREIIYQMALDYYKYNQWDKFVQKLIAKNRPDNLYQSGSTGYEQYYIDLQGFWRELYNPNLEEVLIYKTDGGKYQQEKFYIISIPETSEEEGYDPKVEFDTNKINYYTTDEKREIYSLVSEMEQYDKSKDYYTLEKEKYYATPNYRMGYRWEIFNDYGKTEFTSDYYLKPVDPENYDPTLYSATKYYWNKNVVDAPELLNFWFDFYEGDDNLQQYQIAYIGDRSKVVNDSKITSVYFRKIPQVIFIMPDSDSIDKEQRKTGYTYLRLDNSMADLFAISSRGKSAEEEMTELFNKHSYCTETVSITTIPIYHLEPNTLIHLRNKENHLNGKYQVSKISIPLTYNGMMTISATKVFDVV